ncbi:MAG: hypothetical protein JWQ32_3131 [Marmoricola sp.]|nr:hypothetical protein [Marmoricola sp.]
MQRRLCSAILFLEAIVLGLSTPVLISVESVDRAQALWIGIGLTAACLLTAGLLRQRWAYGLGWAIQLAAIALGVLVVPMYVLGTIFLVLWITAVRLGRTIDTDKAAAA